MKLTFTDEHRPSVQYFQIVSEGRILASNVTPDFVKWIKRQRLRELIQEMRAIAEPVGPMHSFWCSIFYAEDKLNNKLPQAYQSIDEIISNCEFILSGKAYQTSGDHPPVDA